MASKSKCDRCRQPLYGLVACPACREAMIDEAIASVLVSRDPLRLDPEDPESVAAVLRRVFATKKREWARSPEAGADSDDVLVCDALDDTLAAALNAIARAFAAPDPTEETR